jgi:hypothetical protein
LHRTGNIPLFPKLPLRWATSAELSASVFERDTMSANRTVGIFVFCGSFAWRTACHGKWEACQTRKDTEVLVSDWYGGIPRALRSIESISPKRP